MLKLLRHARRESPDSGAPRQWYADEAMDLIVSCDPPDRIRSFQLCYGKPWTQKALMWSEPDSITHFYVDDGENNATANRTPLLSPGGGCETEKLMEEFRARAVQLDAALTQFVLDKISQYAEGRKEKGRES